MLNGSPRKKNTTALIDAHVEGAQENGHEVEVLRVASMDIAGCKGCEYCHTKGEGACIRKDDMSQVIAAYKDADVVVFASPVYYFSMTAQIEAAIQRVYCIDMSPKATKAALLLSSGSPNVYDGPIGQYKSMIGYMGLEDAGIVTAAGNENASAEKLAEVRDLARSL